MIYAAVFVAFILGALFRHYFVTWDCKPKLKPEDFRDLKFNTVEDKPVGKYDHIPLPDDTWIRWNGEARIPVAEDDDFSVMFKDGKTERSSEGVCKVYGGYIDSFLRIIPALWTHDGYKDVVCYKIHGKLPKAKPTNDEKLRVAIEEAKELNGTIIPPKYTVTVKKPKAMTAPITRDLQVSATPTGTGAGTIEYSLPDPLPKIPRGYKRHDGGMCPVKKSQIVRVILRSGRMPEKEVKAGRIGWHHGITDDDIIAYRVIKPKKMVKRGKARKVS